MLAQNPKILAALVKSSRKTQKLSQSRMGQQVGLKQSTVSAFENKPGATKLETFFRILSAANLEIQLHSKNKEKSESRWNEEW